MPLLNSCDLLVIVLKGSHSYKGAFIWRSCKEDESRTNFCLDPYIMYLFIINFFIYNCILLLICLLMDTFIASLPVVAFDIWKMLGVTLNSSFIYPPYLLTQLTLLYQIHLFFQSIWPQFRQFSYIKQLFLLAEGGRNPLGFCWKC